MPYPNPYAGIGQGVTSAGSSIAEALRKLDEQKKQEQTMAILKSFISGQGNTPATDWTSSNVNQGAAPQQPAGTLPPPESYGQSAYGAPVDWTKFDTGEESGGGSKGGSAGGNKGG